MTPVLCKLSVHARTLLPMETREFLALRAGRVPGWKHVRTVHDLGLLRVPSGRLEASDPFVMLGNGLVFAIPPGTYPVKVTVADVSDAADGSHLRESYLSVIIHDGDPVVVENVRPEGVTDQQWLDAASAGEYFGIGVDAGTVGFADAAAIPTSMPPGDWYEDVYDSGEDHSWFALMDSRDHLIPGSANVVMPLAGNGENVVLSHSGWGDGFYPVLASYAADGTLLGVHIDLLVEEPEDEIPA